MSTTVLPLTDSSTKSFNHLHHDRLRNEALLTSLDHTLPESVQEWKNKVRHLRKTLRQTFHVVPYSSPPELEIHGRIDLETYHILRVSFLSAPEIRVTGNLYIPEGPGKFPAVLNLHGHWRQGKIAPAVQARGHILARHGIVVLSIDAAGAGERGEQERVWEYHGATKAGELFLAGDSLMGFQVRDNIRALDVLESLPFVNPDKIGVTGASGGGNQTTWLSALDERVKTAVPVASVGSFEAYIARRNCMCETLPGGLALAEQWQILGMIAPRPLLILNARYDQPAFDCEVMTHTSRKVQSVYHLHNTEASFDWRILEMEHGYKPPALEAMLGWMKHWLANAPSSAPIELPVWESLPEEELLCYPQGERPETCNYASNRRTIAQSIQSCANAGQRDSLAKRIGWKDVSLSQDISLKTQERSTGQWSATIQSPRDLPLQITSSADLSLPLKDIRLILSPSGKESPFVQHHWQESVQQGALAISVDLADTGDLAWDGHTKPNSPFHDSTRACIWLGYSLAGEWAESISLLCAILLESSPQAHIQIIAEQEMAFAGLLALALKPNTRVSLQEHDSLQTFDKLEGRSLVWAIPGFLQWGDLDTLRTLARQPT